MYFIKTPWWLRNIYPQLIWQKKEEKNSVFLTFDDGPIPIVTEFVLEVLKSHQAKATFFCVGENLQKYPGLGTKIIEEGHTLGNHTHQHINGWKNHDQLYLQDIAKCDHLIDRYLGNGRTKLFRPPYGRIKQSQIRKLNNYQIIMWNILSGDFDNKIEPEKNIHKISTLVEPGSIIVFHDSLKAKKNLEYMLPRIINLIQEKNYSFKVL
ncbi:polysaccharide deacetylase family protein [soil metagenome]